MLNAIGGFIFDVDGTIYRGNELLSGAKRTIKAIRKSGKPLVFISNKPLQVREVYAEKLCKLGIPTSAEQIINSSLVMARYLQDSDPDAPVYVIGEEGLVEELKNHGITISSDPKKIRYVIASFDRNFHYEKLQVAYQAMERGAKLVATNSDRTCPVKGGEIPDAAGMISAIEGVTGKEVEMIAGKPSSYMLQSALDVLKVEPEKCLLVGDRLETDIKMGLNNDITSVLVLTGVTSREDLAYSEVEPDYVLETLEDFPTLVGL